MEQFADEMLNEAALLEEIGLMLRDFFIAEIERDNGGLRMTFGNGQRFVLSLRSV